MNFDLLVKIFRQVMETERPQFIGALLKLVERPFRAQPVSRRNFHVREWQIVDASADRRILRADGASE